MLRSAFIGVLLFVSVVAVGTFLFSERASAQFCFEGNCLQGAFCNNSADCMGPASSLESGRSAISLCGSSASSVSGCTTSWWPNTLRSKSPQKGSFCIRGDCVSPKQPQILFFSANDSVGEGNISKGEKVDFKFRIDDASRVDFTNVPTDIVNQLNTLIGEDVRKGVTRIDRWTGSYYPQEDTSYTLRAYNDFASPFVTSNTLVVKVKETLQTCMADAMGQAKINAESNYLFRASCLGLSYGTNVVVTASTGITFLGGLVGGTLGALCDTANTLTALYPLKERCDRFVPEGKTPTEIADAFIGSFARTMIKELFAGLFQGFFGGLFQSLRCIPFIGNLIDAFVSGLGGMFGRFIGGFISGMGENQLDMNDPAIFVASTLGSNLGRGIGNAVGYEVGRHAGGALSQILGFVKVDGAPCPSIDPEEKSKKYGCDRTAKMCKATTEGKEDLVALAVCNAACIAEKWIDQVLIGLGWDTTKRVGDALHNAMASNLIQRMCSNITEKVVTAGNASKIATGSSTPDGPRTKDGLIGKGQSGLFHCLWQIYEQVNGDTRELNKKLENGLPSACSTIGTFDDLIKIMQAVCNEGLKGEVIDVPGDLSS